MSSLASTVEELQLSAQQARTLGTLVQEDGAGTIASTMRAIERRGLLSDVRPAPLGGVYVGTITPIGEMVGRYLAAQDLRERADRRRAYMGADDRYRTLIVEAENYERLAQEAFGQQSAA